MLDKNDFLISRFRQEMNVYPIKEFSVYIEEKTDSFMKAKMMNLKKYFRNLSIIFWALLAVQVLFTAMVLVMVQSFGPIMDSPGNMIVIFQGITVLIAVGSLIAIRMITKMRLQKILKEENFNKIMNAYRANMILKYALMEAPVFFVLIFYLMTADTLFLILSFLLIIVFFLNKPDRKKIVDELRINYSDRIKLGM